MKVLDIGCGWGDMALYLGRMADVQVVGVTLSKEQHALANEQGASAARPLPTACASSCATTAT